MIKKHTQFLLSLLFLNTVAIYYPILDFIKKNDILKQYYGLNPVTFSILCISTFLVPVVFFGLISFLFNRKVDTQFKILLTVYSLIVTLSVMTGMGIIKSIPILVFISIFIFASFKKIENSIWVLSILGFLILFDAPYKTIRAFKSHFKHGWYKYEQYNKQINQLELKEDAPRNIVFILLDGSDITTSLLDQDNFPLKGILPNLHELTKHSFAFFPYARTNAPQTYASLPIIFTGTRHFPEAANKFENGRSMLHMIQAHFDNSYVFAYKNYYQSFCEESENRCYPFDEGFDSSDLFKMTWEVFLYNHSFHLFDLPVKLGRDFVPEAEKYSFSIFKNKIQSMSPEQRNFFFLHIFRRNRKDIIQFDSELNEMIEILKNKGMYDDTLFAIFSDHGLDQSQTEKHMYGFDSPQNDKIIRVPVFIRFGDRYASGIHSDIIENADLYFTLLSMIFKSNPLLSSDGQDIFSKHYKPNTDKFYNCSSSGKMIGFKDVEKFTLSKCE